MFPLLFSTHSRFLLYLLVPSSLFYSLRLFFLYLLVSSSLLYSFKASSLPSCSLFSSLLYSFKVSALPSCSLFSFLLIKAFFFSTFLCRLLFSSLLFSTHSKLLLYPLCFPFSFLLYPIKASSLPSCSPFSSLLFSTHSRFLLYLLVSSSLFYSLRLFSLPSCVVFSSLLYSFKSFFSTFLFPLLFSSLLIQGFFSTHSRLLFSTYSRLLLYLLVPLLFCYHSRFILYLLVPITLLAFHFYSLLLVPVLFSIFRLNYWILW